MKTLRPLCLLLFIFTLTAVDAQRVRTYKVWVTLLDKTNIRGTLYAANQDLFVILGEDLAKLGFSPESLQEIKVRRRGKVGKGAWIGALSGAVIGGTAGLAGGDVGFIDAEAIGAGYAILGATIGVLTGMAISSGKEVYIINGDRNVYKSLLPELQQYAPEKVSKP
ncbi:hypothetical protein [Robiginitalea marina]|uniref:Glycine zipper family protein n=1 Tax=Robiginitalea marina TaxID=2954105 RepID=A0ABT1ATX3_9FLAO|nr:hypothetical protein [Robiginitalea marina]MCO5723362.1 hypothetical protein [Robiginitalea marina]